MKRWKRALALILAAAMSLSLFGCGKKEEQSQNKTLAQELGYGYLSKYSDLNMDLDYIRSVTTAQGKLFVCGEYYDDETYESGTLLFAMDLATGEQKEIPMPELVNTDNTNEWLQALSVCADANSYWMVTDRYTFTPIQAGLNDEVVPFEEGAAAEEAPAEEAPAEEAPAEELPADEEPEEGLANYSLQMLTNEVAAETEPAEAPEDAPAEETPADEAPADEAAAEGEEGVMPIDEPYTEPQEQYFAKKVDMNGNVLTEIDLTEATKDLEYFYCQYMAQNSEGDLLIASDSAILVFSADGQRKDNITMNEGYINSMTSTGDGTVLVSYYDWSSDDGGQRVCRIENGALSEPMEIAGINETGGISLYPGDGGNMLLNDNTYLYTLDTATGQATKLLSWLDSDINGSYINGIAANGQDTVLVLLQSWHRSLDSTMDTVYELGTLTKVPAEEIPERTILTLGATYLSSNLEDAVIDFNRGSDTYRITLVDYGAYNTNEDYTAGSKQMDMDVISGNCPDLIDLSSGNAEKYIGKGVLADLGALMDKDDSISMDQFLSGPIKAYQKDGKLYGLPTAFGLVTLYGSTKLLNGRTSWTLAEMAEVIEGLGDDVQIMQYRSQTSFLSEMLQQNITHYVDYSNATCSFDSEDFKLLLRAAAKLPTDDELTQQQELMMSESYVYTDENQGVQSGETLLTSGYLSYADAVKERFSIYTEENGFTMIGYPTDQGNGAVLNASGGLAISEKSANKDGAWAFLKTLFTDDFQTGQWSLPVTVSAFDQFMEAAMTPEYYTDENGQQVESNYSTYIDGTAYEVKHITQEQADWFKDYVNGAEISGIYDSDLYEIINEEAAAYFAGDKSADEVAKLIQNRVSIYLGETS